MLDNLIEDSSDLNLLQDTPALISFQQTQHSTQKEYPGFQEATNAKYSPQNISDQIKVGFHHIPILL